jgi:hypothetical protein
MIFYPQIPQMAADCRHRAYTPYRPYMPYRAYAAGAGFPPIS